MKKPGVLIGIAVFFIGNSLLFASSGMFHNFHVLHQDSRELSLLCQKETSTIDYKQYFTDPEVTGEMVVDEVIGPVLAELEAHLRAHMFAGMLPRDVKVLVSDWIESQISSDIPQSIVDRQGCIGCQKNYASSRFRRPVLQQ